MPNTHPMNISLSILRLYERDYTHRKSCGFGCLPRLIEKHRFIFIVDSNHRADKWGPPSPVKCYIQLRSVPSIPPPLTLHRGKTNTFINKLEGSGNAK
eukprot:scaffold64255_cov24-Cyclotella_meneghiniana.AAC.1